MRLRAMPDKRPGADAGCHADQSRLHGSAFRPLPAFDSPASIAQASPMRPAPRLLLNTPDIELWPGGLLRARGSHDARLLSRARTVLRRKRDGRYLAAVLP